MAKVVGNIFEEFSTAQTAVLNGGVDANGKPVYSAACVKYMAELNAYFKSMKWARNEKEKAIYLRSGKGLRTAEISAAMGINPNTYRSMVSTLSKRLRDLLFDGESLSDAVLRATVEKIKVLRNRLRAITLNFDFYSLYSDYELGLIEKYSQPNGVSSEPTEEEKFVALFVLTLISKQTIEFRLSSLNPVALQRVIEELTSSEYTVWKAYYQKLGVGAKPRLSETAIKSLKEGVD